MIVMYTDGGCSPNPGERTIGVSLQTKDGIEIETISEKLGYGTNNEAEYLAIYYGLLKAKELLKFGYKNITIKSDSQLAINALSNGYKNFKAMKLVHILKAIKPLEKDFTKVTYIHIPRELNTRADGLANQAYQKPVVVSNLDITFTKIM